jgi:hypothetical protein
MSTDFMTQLAQDGAQVLVGAMVTDAWKQVRDRVASLLGRGNRSAEQAEVAALEDFREAIESARPEVLAEVTREQQAELRGMLRVRLRSDPALAAEFASVINEVRRLLPEAETRVTSVRQTAHADRGSTVNQAGRDVTHAGRDIHIWPPRNN